jgi:hypothetical protein
MLQEALKVDAWWWHSSSKLQTSCNYKLFINPKKISAAAVHFVSYYKGPGMLDKNTIYIYINIKLIN